MMSEPTSASLRPLSLSASIASTLNPLATAPAMSASERTSRPMPAEPPRRAAASSARLRVMSAYDGHTKVRSTDADTAPREKLISSW